MEHLSRDAALQLLHSYNQSESLVNHALAVEGVMRYFAPMYKGDPDLWGITGLLHDLDYEKFPEQHCIKTAEILKNEGYPDVVIRGTMSHGWGICTDVRPESDMEKVLYAIDELTGLVTASVYVRPNRSILDLSVTSVKKKWKQKGFSAGVNRELIKQGAEALGMELDTLIAHTIDGMKTVARDIGLEGNPAEQGGEE
ncbi:MAG: HDIG domain-containing protein [Spirochaetales bacterium]|nr:HDIG domain-containing protein [Spirochaetales bacterium]